MLIALSFLFGLGVILLAVAVLAVRRQLRITRRSLTPLDRLPVSEVTGERESAPIVSAPAISGETLTIGGLSRDPRLLLLLFVEPGSHLCDAMVREAVELCADVDVRLLLLGEGDAEDYAALMTSHGLGADDIILDAAAGEDFQVGPVPSAALIDASGQLLARGTVQRREQLEALLAAVGPEAQPQLAELAGSATR
jgi:methylamine dehydrogenase accessory protein MauD